MQEEGPHQEGMPKPDQDEQASRQPVHLTKEDTLTEPQEYTLYPVQDQATSPLKTIENVEDQNLTMEVDTGASVTIISEATLRSIWWTQSVPPLHPTDVRLRTYNGKGIPVVGQELRSFLGLVNYYGKFLPNLASTAAPLYTLLWKNASWVWGEAQKAAFMGVKELLQSANLLVHFDPEQQLILACEASPYGLGAVLYPIACKMALKGQ